MTAESQRREAEALELRRAGVTFDEIARRLGYASRGAARAAYVRARKRADSIDDADVDLEVDRIDRLQAAVWAKAVRGDPKAQENVIRLMELRARLRPVRAGEDGPMRVAFDATVAASSKISPTVDAGVIATGRALADRIDQATATGAGQEVTKALYLVPHLMNVYRELLATPAARAAAGGAGDAEKGGRLLQMRTAAASATGRSA